MTMKMNLISSTFNGTFFGSVVGKARIWIFLKVLVRFVRSERDEE